jgi:hypothetical protein
MASLVCEEDPWTTDWAFGSASLGPAFLEEPHLEADTDPPDTIPPITPQYRQLAVVIVVALWQQVARFVEAQLSSRWTSSFPPTLGLLTRLRTRAPGMPKLGQSINIQRTISCTPVHTFGTWTTMRLGVGAYEQGVGVLRRDGTIGGGNVGAYEAP